KPFLRNLSFSLVDLRGMTLGRPALVRALLAEMMELFEARQPHPLAHQVFPAAETADAFRRMAQAKHIGKMVISFEESRNTPIADGHVQLFRPDRTCLITGGLGGLGLITARWMIGQGARHLVLMGRSAPSETAAAEI